MRLRSHFGALDIMKSPISCLGKACRPGLQIPKFSPKLVILRLGLFLSTVWSLDLSTMDRTRSAPVVASKPLSEGCGVVWKVTQPSTWLFWLFIFLLKWVLPNAWEAAGNPVGWLHDSETFKALLGRYASTVPIHKMYPSQPYSTWRNYLQTFPGYHLHSW